MKHLCVCTLLVCCTGFASAPPLLPDARPKVIRHRAPAVASSMANPTAEVDVLVEINEAGHVINAAIQRATDPRLAVPCLRAIRKWRYEPARQDGVPIRASFVQPFRFGYVEPEPPPLASAPPLPRRRITPEIPPDLVGQPAEVTVALNLSATGQIEDVQVISSTNARFDEPTVDAALRWTFDPAIREGLPVPSRVHIPFAYLGDAQKSPRSGPVVQVAKRVAPAATP